MRTKDLKSSKAITLIALVVTIIVLLILLGTAVASITGRKGVIGQAQDAKSASEIEDIRENITLAYVQAEGKRQKANEDLSSKIKEELDKDYDSGNTSVSKEDSGEYIVIVNGKTFIINSRDKVLTEEEYAAEDVVGGNTLGTTSNDSGVGYYINKGTAQNPEYAIVFADRVAQQGTTVTWSSTNTSSCTFPTLSTQDIAGFKTYQVNGTYNDLYFGEHPVLEVVGNVSGEDRFLALALSNLATNGTEYTWYDAAYGNMSDFNATGGTDGKGTPTSKAFLAGRTNTQTMITKWNAGTNGGYGAQDTNSSNKDVWGQIQTQYSNGWFVPSFEEWSAVGWAISQGKLKQNVTSCSSLGLSTLYWSSSQYSTDSAWFAYLYGGCMSNNWVDSNNYVRLATTF